MSIQGESPVDRHPRHFPLLVEDLDAEGNPTWSVASYVLLAIVVMAPVLGAAQALLVEVRNAATFPRITQKLDHE